MWAAFISAKRTLDGLAGNLPAVTGDGLPSSWVQFIRGTDSADDLEQSEPAGHNNPMKEIRQTEKDEPQPQVGTAFGLFMTNRAPCKSSL